MVRSAARVMSWVRLFNADQSCDSLCVSAAALADVDAFVRVLGDVSDGGFLACGAPADAVLQRRPWVETKVRSV